MTRKFIQCRFLGFTLIEVMVSLAIFSVGMLGIAYLTARGVNINADNGLYRSAIQVARQYVEPLHEALRAGPAQLRTRLRAMGPVQSAPLSAADGVAKEFEISLVDAVDDKAQNLTTTDVALWQPPLHIRVDVRAGDHLVFHTYHVLVPL